MRHLSAAEDSWLSISSQLPANKHLEHSIITSLLGEILPSY